MRICNVTVVVCVLPPPVPAIVKVNVPRVRPAVTVSVELVPGDMTGLGLKLAFASLGKPLTLRLTASLKPPVGVIVTVYVVLLLRRTSRDAGVAVMLKSDVGEAGPL